MVWNAGFFPRVLALPKVDLDCEVTEVRGNSVVNFSLSTVEFYTQFHKLAGFTWSKLAGFGSL